MRTRLLSPVRPLSISLTRFSSTAAMCAAMALAASTARAVTNSWTAGSNADFNWDSVTNWTLAKPVATHDVLFPTPIPNPGALPNPQIISLTSGEVANSLTFRDAYNLTGGDLTLGIGGRITVATGMTTTIDSQYLGTEGLTLAASNGLAGGDAQTGGGTLVLTAFNSFIGPVAVNAGTLRLTNLGAIGDFTNVATVAAGATLQFQAGAGTLNNSVVLNGGTVSQLSLGQVSLGFGQTLTIGATGATVDVAGGGGSSSKILLAPDQLVGSGTFTKTGAGDFQLSGATGNPLFTGAAIVNAGTLEFQNVDALGTGTTTVTINSGGEFVSTTVPVRHNFTLNTGATLSANGTANAVNYTGSINVAGNANMALRFFQTLTTANGFRISGPLSGAGGLIVSAPANTATLVLAGNNSAYTGTVTINSGTVQVNSQAALSATNQVIIIGGNFGLAADGNGTGAPETFAFNHTITVAANGGFTVGRIGNTFAPLFTQAANKTLQEGGALSIGAFTLTVNNNNGFGLDLTNTITLTGTPTFSVATATVSNVVQGLRISGKVTGAFGFTKAGVGTMVLANATNDFAGPISVTGGVLGATNDGALGNPTNQITLNGATAGFEAYESFATSRTINLANATPANNLLLVAAGKTLTLNAAFGNVNGFQKSDPGVLVLNADNTATTTGANVVSGGIVRVTNAGALGATAGNTTVVNNSGTALQIDGTAGSLTIAEPLVLNNTGLNTGGALQNFAGTNTISGAIALATAAAIGADTGTTLNLNGGITGATFALTLAGGGTGNVNSVIGTTTGSVTKLGTGTWTLTATNTFTGAPIVNQGTLVVSGVSGTVATGGSPWQISPGATLVLDNTSAHRDNRLGTKGVHFGGNLTIIGDASAPTIENISGSNLLSGNTGSVLTLQADPAQPLTLTVTTSGNSFNRNAFGSTLYRGTNLGGTPGAGVATMKSTVTAPTFVGQTGAAGLSNRGILPWALVDQSTSGFGTAFATYDATNGIMRLGQVAGETTATLTANANVALGAATPAPGTTLINSLTLNASGGLNGVGVLQLDSGGLLAFTGNSGLSGGLLTTTANRELFVHVLDATGAPGASLDIGSTIGGFTGGLTKADNGTLILSAPETYTGATTVNGGTLSLNGGTNTLVPGQQLNVNVGGTLNLNGNRQLVGDLISLTSTGNEAPRAGGAITGAAGSMLTINQSNNGRTFAGTLTGAISLTRSGLNTLALTNASDYTGATVLTGGTTVLRDTGRLSGTSSIDINYGTLQLDNSGGTTDLADRINDAAPISLRGGAIIFNSRAQSAGTETFGELRLVRGSSNLNPLRANVGVESIEMTFSKLTQVSPDGMVNFNGTNGTFGQIGNNFRILFTTVPTVTNNILSPAIESGGSEFATYIPGLGLAALNAVGAAGYDGTTLPAVNQPTQNIRLAASASVPFGGLTLNTLNMVAGVNVSFSDPSDALNLAAGGLIKSGNNVVGFGSFPDDGRLTAGGTASTGTVPLYIHIGSNTTSPLTINSRIIDNPNGAKLRLIYTNFNGGTMGLANGLNSYTGGTVVNGWINNNTGSLTLNGNFGDVVVPAGGLTINNSTVTEVANGGQIHSSNVVTLSGNSTLNLVSANSLAGLVFENDGGTVNPAVNTGGVLMLPGGASITASSQNAATIPQINGTLEFSSANPTITANPVTIAGQNIGATVPTLNIGGVIQGIFGFNKAGSGILGLGGANTLTGPTNVNAGTLQFTGAAGGLAGSAVTLAAGTTLNLGGFNPTLGSLAGTGAVINSINNLPLATVNVLGVGASGASSSFGGLISGALVLGKIGGGTFSLTTVANTFTGGVSVSGGIFQLPGAGLTTTGSGVFSVNNGGTLSGAGLLPAGLTLNPGSAASFALGAVAPVSTGTANLVTRGPATINLTGAPSVGTFPLIDYGGTALSASQFAGFRLGTNPGGGFLYGLVNNVGATSVDVRVETLGAANTWTGAASGTWTPGDATNWNVAYADGQQVTFSNSGLNKTISGPAVAPQAINVNNSTGNDYTIGNALGGTLAGGLTKSGTGTLQLTGANTFTGAITVGGGTLRASVATGVSSLGSGNITLNGTTLELDPTASANPGMTGRTILGAVTSNVVAQRDFATVAADTRTYFTAGNVDTGTVAPYYTGGPADNFQMQFTGKLNITAPGLYSFFTTSDDGSRAFVDGVLVAGNDGSHGATGGDVGGAPIFLNAGYHDFRTEFAEGTGGSQLTLRWQGPGFAKTLLPAANVFTPETSSNDGTSNNILIGNNLSFSGNSTIKLNGVNFVGVEVGGLQAAAGSTLTVQGAAGKVLRAASTIFSGGTTTIFSTPDLALGQMLDNGTAVTVVKQGTGRLILDDTAFLGAASSLLSNSILEIQAGKLSLVGAVANNTNGATNPAGAAQIRLNGGGLVLDTKGSTIVGGGTTTFDNALTIAQSSTIEVVPPGSGTAATVSLPIALGSAANGIALGTGTTVTFDVFGGARTATAIGGGFFGNQVGTTGANLVVNGPVTGNGAVTIQSSQFNGAAGGLQMPAAGSVGLTAANTYTGVTTLKGLIYNAPNTFGAGLPGAAATSGQPLTLTLSGNGTILDTSGIAFTNGRLVLNNATTNLPSRIADTQPIALNNGVFTFTGSTTASSSEFFGKLNANSGFNVVTMNNVSTGNTTVLNGSELARTNRAQVAFMGTSLGGTATNSNLIRFDVPPTAQLVGGGGIIGGTAKNVSILPYAVGTTNGALPATWQLVSYDSTTNSMRPLNANEYNTLGAGVAGENSRSGLSAAATTATPAPVTVNAYLVENTAAANVAIALTIDTNPISIGSGALVFAATNATPGTITINPGVGSPSVVFAGGVEAVITTMNIAGAIINNTITGTNGLTVGGLGQLTLTGNNAATLTGAITLNGQLSIPADTALGAPANPLNMNGGNLRFTAATTLPDTRTVTMLDGTISGFDTATGNSVIAGQVTGGGSLVKIDNNTLTLSNPANNYTGPTSIQGGTLQLTGGVLPGDILNNGALILDQPAATTATYAGSVTGFGTVTKQNDGTAILNGQSRYSGATNINAGTLLVNGSIAGSTTTVSGATAVLGGSGTTGNLVASSGATVAPGITGSGILASGDFTLNASARFAIDIGGAIPGSGYDQLNVTGGISLAGDLQGSLLNGFVPANGQTFFIVLNDGLDAVTGTFTGLAEGAPVAFGPGAFTITYQANFGGTGPGNDVALLAVPEPGSSVSLLGGVASLLGLQRFRRRRS